MSSFVGRNALKASSGGSVERIGPHWERVERVGKRYMCAWSERWMDERLFIADVFLFEMSLSVCAMSAKSKCS